ncbi:PREDICTED: natural cytotoxicity triggering receptor 3 ligand 1-like [Nanorana parkeri]|uniref:natural cytotoxicity triggering receptor 3 ligand 1-like n=1 Tax=Nanorana parkeri TaxID=125878 RepID=UPI000854B765|nr:PREDICTED: natural cytotoxicity triggering receptor 3 ligand 1-like [Nanorana parkeri]
MECRLTRTIIICVLLTAGSWFFGVEAFIKLNCQYEKIQEGQWMNASLPPQKAWLVVGSRPEVYKTLEGPTFVFKDSSINLMPFLKADLEKLKCKIKSYFTDNIQVLWPDIPPSDNTQDSWYIVTTQHTDEKFQMSTFFTILTQTPSTAERDDDIHDAVATFTTSTHTPHIYTRLNDNVVLDCAFTVDHKAEASVTWHFQGSGRRNLKLLSYNGSTKQLEYHRKNSVMQVEKIQKGIASLSVTNVALENQGQFTCTVSVGSLYAEQQINLEIRESPVVSVNVESVTLTEGEEQKFVCDASNYYPLNVNIEWLQEGQHGGFLPTLVPNLIYSSHKYNRDGTFSLSGSFLYTASLQDSGSTFTCRVEHESLSISIKKKVTLTVLERNGWTWTFLQVMIIIFILIIICGVIALWKGCVSTSIRYQSRPIYSKAYTGTMGFLPRRNGQGVLLKVDSLEDY